MISETQAQTFLSASSLAYQPTGPSPGSGYQFLQAFPDAETGFLALVYRNPDTNKCIVAFTGTQPSFQDAYADLNLGWPQWSANRDPLFEFLATLKADPNQGLEQVDFTGHSLGGALAQYAAYQYANEADPAPFTLTTFNAFGGLQGIVQNLAPGQSYDSTRLAGIDVNHFRVASDMVSRLGEGHVGGNVRVIDLPTPNFYAAHVLDQSFLSPAYAGYQLTALPAATPNYLHVSTGQQLGAALGNLFNNGTYNEFEAALRTTGALLLVLQLAPASEIDQVMDAMFPQYAQINWGIVRSILPVSGGAVVLGGAGLILAAGAYEGMQGAADRLSEVKTFLNQIMGESFSALNTVPAGQAGLRMAVYLAGTTGVGLASSALGQTLSALTIDHAQFTTHLLSGANWLNDSVNYLRAQANTAGQNVADFSARLASGIFQEAHALAGTAADFLASTTTVLSNFLLDTAHGISNAVSDFLQDVVGAFDLGRALNFNDVNLIAQAYAAELDDRRLAAPIRTALEDAQALVQRAGQTVVISKGMGPNPFNGVGFNPNDPGTISTATLPEGQLQAYTLALPFEAGVGGQRVQLQLSGTGVSALRVRVGGTALTPQNGLVTLLVPEGQRQIVFGLQVTDDIDVDGGLTLSATLLDANSVATHTTHQEATLTVDAQVEGTIDYNNGLPGQTFTGDDTNNAFGPLGGGGGAFNVTAFGNGGDDFIFANTASQGNHQFFGGMGADLLQGALGHDRLYGEVGRDILIGFEGDDVLEGGDQEDALSGGLGDDVLDGGTGDDSLTGNGGKDVLRGSLGADLLAGDAVVTALADMGADSLDGGAGNDWLFGLLGDDELEGGADDDHLYGDTLPAGSPSFNYEWPGLITPVAAIPFTSLTGDDDYLDGGAGADYLQGDAGDDILLGGAGNDELVGDDLQVGVIQEGADWLEGEGGNDTLVGGGGEDALFGGDGNDLLVGDYANNGVLGFDDTLDGGAGADQLQGGGGHDLLLGGSDGDLLFGEAGDDVLDGGQGADELQGGDGADLLAVC